MDISEGKGKVTFFDLKPLLRSAHTLMDADVAEQFWADMLLQCEAKRCRAANMGGTQDSRNALLNNGAK